MSRTNGAAIGLDAITMVLNLKNANALGITLWQSLQLCADEVIQ